MKRKIAVEIICFLFVVLFTYAALNKLADFQKFKIQVGQSPMLAGFGDSIPWMVIVLELCIVAMLIFPRLRLAGLFASFCLMTMFTVYIYAILNFSAYVPCSCGGVLEKLGWSEHLMFNIFFVFLGLVGIILQSAEGSTSTKSLAFKKA